VKVCREPVLKVVKEVKVADVLVRIVSLLGAEHVNGFFKFFDNM